MRPEVSNAIETRRASTLPHATVGAGASREVQSHVKPPARRPAATIPMMSLRFGIRTPERRGAVGWWLVPTGGFVILN